MTMTDQAKPLPCRMCGRHPLEDVTTMGQRYVGCGHSDCMAMGPKRKTKREAIAAWNDLMSPAVKLPPFQPGMECPDQIALDAAIACIKAAGCRVEEA